MVNKVLSIEIGTDLIKICIVNKAKNNIKVFRTLVIDTPSDCIEDGYIKNTKLLAEQIGQRLKKSNVVIKNVIFTVSSTRIANREVNIPLVKQERIQNIVEANACDYFPIDVADYRITYSILEKINTKEEKHYRLLVLAVQNNLLMTYYELAQELNLHILYIDYIGNSVYQVLRKQLPEGIHMAVQMNATNSLINVMKDGILELQRTIPYGYMSVVETVLGNSYFEADTETAAFELLKDQCFINPHFGKKDVTDEENTIGGSYQIEDEAKEDITESLSYLINNILRVYDYYMNKHPDNKIQNIYLTGAGSKLYGITQLLSNEMDHGVNVIEQLSCANFIREFRSESFTQSDYMSCIGAVMKPVGLMPKQYLEKVEKKSNIQSAAIIATLSLAASLILAVLSSQMLGSAVNEKKELTKEINDLAGIDELYTKYLKTKDESKRMETINSSCNSNTQNLVQLFDEMEQKLPSKVTVHSFRTTDSELLIDFVADSYETVAMVLKQLKTITLITDVNTTTVSKQEEEQGVTEVSFSVSAFYKNAQSNQNNSDVIQTQAGTDQTTVQPATGTGLNTNTNTDTASEQTTSSSNTTSDLAQGTSDSGQSNSELN